MKMRPKVYMAGPDVFLPDALGMAAAKKAILAAHGFEGLHPFDNEIDFAAYTPDEASRRIKEANCAMMRDADAIIANLTPFHGPSADVGTAYEVGFMDALNKPVFGYMNVKETFLERVKVFNGGRLAKDADGTYRDRFRMMVENFGLRDNLMLEWAVRRIPGGNWSVHAADEGEIYTSLTAFEGAVRIMANIFEEGVRIHAA